MTKEDFFKGYRGRYSQYWDQRFGMIPNLPTSYDNSNDIYELLAWLQRGFKLLLDDFKSLEIEQEEFKNAIVEMLENLIPAIIREFIKSEEFRSVIFDLINSWYDLYLKPIINNILSDINNIKNDINNIKADITALENTVNQLLSSINNLTSRLNTLENRIEMLEANNEKLNKIIQKLTDIGVWSGNDFKAGMGIAGGNINLFGGTPDGNYFIRTNKGATENDLVGGV